MAKKNKQITPGDILFALVGNDPKAIVGAIKGKNKADGKYDSRTITRNEKGQVIVNDTKLIEKTKKPKKSTKKRK